VSESYRVSDFEANSKGYIGVKVEDPDS